MMTKEKKNEHINRIWKEELENALGRTEKLVTKIRSKGDKLNWKKLAGVQYRQKLVGQVIYANNQLEDALQNIEGYLSED